jgi:lathosterol oxidase
MNTPSTEHRPATDAQASRNSPDNHNPDNHHKGKSEWHYHPPLPIDNNPLFSWPIRWRAALVYYRDSWLTLSEATFFVGLAILLWTAFGPDLDQATQLHYRWVGGIWLRNLFVLMIVAGGLHYYFFARRQQGTELKYVASFMSTGSRFLFSNQLFDNMFYALVSGVLVWSAYEVLMVWAMANGFVQRFGFADHPIWFILALPCIRWSMCFIFPQFWCILLFPRIRCISGFIFSPCLWGRCSGIPDLRLCW